MTFIIDLLVLAISVFNAAVTVAIMLALMPLTIVGELLDRGGEQPA